MRRFVPFILLAILAGFSPLLRGDSAVGQALEGTWLVDVTFTTPTTLFPPSFKGFDTYLPGGAYIGASNVSPQAFHGEWARTGNRQFVQTFQFFVFDSKGGYAAYVKIRALQELEDSLDHMHGVFTAELYSPDGKLLSSANGVVQSRRMALEAPDLTIDPAPDSSAQSSAGKEKKR